MQTAKKTSVTTAYKAKLVIDYDLAKKIRYFVTEVPTECQWYTAVSRETDEDTSTIIFRLYGDILIPEQKVGGEDVEMADDISMMKMWKEYEKLTTEAHPEWSPEQVDKHINTGMQTAWNWCHSHVKLEAKPSPTDQKQWESWVKMHSVSGKPEAPPTMLIINKSEDVFARAYDPVTKIQFDWIPVEVTEDPDIALDYVKDAIATKLQPFVKEPPKPKEQPKKQWGPSSSTNSQFDRYQGYGGGSQGLRAANAPLHNPGSGNILQTVDSLPGEQGYYYALDSKHKYDLSNIYNTFHKTKSESIREAELSKLFRWVYKYIGPNGFTAIGSYIEAYHLPLDIIPLTLVLDGIQSVEDKVSRTEPNEDGTVLAELIDLDKSEFLDLLDAMLVIAEGKPEEGIAALEEFYLNNNQIIDTPSNKTESDKPIPHIRILE